MILLFPNSLGSSEIMDRDDNSCVGTAARCIVCCELVVDDNDDDVGFFAFVDGRCW
jgi:hypothetical protein